MKSKTEVNIYMVCTPLSFIFAYQLAKIDSNKKILVLKKDFDISYILQILIKYENNLFFEIVILEKSLFHPGKLDIYKNIFKNRVTIFSLKRRYKIIECFIPNPYIPEFTLIANSSTKKILFEEGIGLFKDSENDAGINIFRLLIKKIIYGISYTEIQKTKNFLSYFHEYILSDVSFSKNMNIPIGKKITPILDIKQKFNKFSESDFFSGFKNEFKIKTAKKTEILIILPRTTCETEMPNDMIAFIKFLDNLQDKYGDKVYFKYHPREENFYFGSPDSSSVFPAEILLLSFPNLHTIMGINSSILYNAIRYNNCFKVISLIDYFGYTKENINTFFKKNNIFIPRTHKDLEKLLLISNDE